MDTESTVNRGEGQNFAVLPSNYRLHWYEFESVLGRGGFGITYLARDTNLNHMVAIKEYLPTELAVRTSDRTVHPLSDEHVDVFKWGLSRFIEEAQTLAQFSHPNIVPVRSVFEANNTAYMIMDYVEGVSFAKALRSPRYNDEVELKRIFFQLLDGVEQIHNAGYIHRDIKPDNIFMQASGIPVLLDFGSARESTGARTLTALVTPGYAPFEQYDSSNESDRQGPWTDIYALGALLYRTVTGRAPVDAMGRMAAMLDGKDTLEPASALAAGKYSPAFLQAIDNALAFRPSERPQSIAQWRTQFELDNGDAAEFDEDDEPTVLGPQAITNREPDTATQNVDSATVPDHTSSGVTRRTPQTFSQPEPAPVSPASAVPTEPAVDAQTPFEQATPKAKSKVLVYVSLAIIIAVNAGGAYYLWGDAFEPQVSVSQALPEVLPYREIRAPASLLQPQIQQLAAVTEDYQAVLELDPANPVALAGLSKVAEDFIDLASFARVHLSQAVAAKVINQGLQTLPGNAALLNQQALRDEVTSASADAATQTKIEQLITLAKQDIVARRLLEPANENAVARLKTIRQLDPSNQFASQQLEQLGRFFYEASREAFVASDVDSGVQILEQGLIINPRHPQLLWLRSAVASRMNKP